MKKVLLFFAIFIGTLALPLSISAQTYQTTQSIDVNVGKVPSNGTIVRAAQAITNGLSKSGGTLYDQFTGRPRGAFSNMTLPTDIQQLFPSYKVVLRRGGTIGPAWRYWCTDLIIDSYNLALGKRIIGENLGSVQSQVAFWRSHGNGFLLAHYSEDRQGSLQKLFTTAPDFGEPIFWESNEGVHNGFEHVGLIRSGFLDSHGNGEIDTYESNAWSKTGKYPIHNWVVKNVPYPVVGFGLYTGSIQ